MINVLEVQQGSQAWLDARMYRFTSSDLIKLFAGGRRYMTEDEIKARDRANVELKAKNPKAKSDTRTTVDTLFGDGALTYIHRKVTASLTGGVSEEYHYFESKNTDWGKEYEPYAAERFCNETGLSSRECGFYAYNDFFGGSPDRIIETQLGEAVLEIKCPANSITHLTNLRCKDAADLKRLNEDHYCQIQGNMLATGLKNAFFVSYDWRFVLPELQIKIIEIPYDPEYQAEILMRLDAAAEEMSKILEEITGI